jgi:hypothetical protein
MKPGYISYPPLVGNQYQSPLSQPLFKTWRYRYRKLLRDTYPWNYLLYWCTPETRYVILKDLISLEIPRGLCLFHKRVFERRMRHVVFRQIKSLNTDTIREIIEYL